MKNIFIKKTHFASLTFLSFFLTTNSYGQEKFIEKNLPQTELNETAKPTPIKSQGSNFNDAKNLIKDSIDKIILHKKPTSLMYDDEESLAIKAAVEAFKNEPLDPELRAKKLDGTENSGLVKNEAANEKFNIYLSSILYLNAKNWAIWVNNQKITSRNNKRDDEIFVKSVTSEKVKLIWQMSVTKWKILSGAPEDSDETPPINKDNKVEIAVELKPNQTYVLGLKRVFEGKIFAKVSKVEGENSNPNSTEKTTPNPSEKSEDLKKVDVKF